MAKSKLMALALVASLLGISASASAQVAPPANPQCDPAVMAALADNAQRGFNAMSLVTTAMMKPPVPTLSSLCQQMVNSVWNPQRFIEEAALSVIAFPMVYSYSMGGFSLSFNPVNIAAKAILQGLMQKASLGFVCTDTFNGIGNALRQVNYNPATGQIALGMPLNAGGFSSFISGFSGTLTFNGNVGQVTP